MQSFTYPVSFHKSRTIPLSDVSKLLLQNRNPISFKLERLALSNESETPIPIILSYDYGMTTTQSDITLASQLPYDFPLTAESKLAALGLKEYTMLRLEAMFPRSPHEEPYSVLVHLDYVPISRA
jgi:hypothetical protein